jgi:hypothetical protein
MLPDRKKKIFKNEQYGGRLEGLIGGFWSTINPITGQAWISENEYLSGDWDAYLAQKLVESQEATEVGKGATINIDGDHVTLTPYPNPSSTQFMVRRNELPEFYNGMEADIQFPIGMSLLLLDETGLHIATQAITTANVIAIIHKTAIAQGFVALTPSQMMDAEVHRYEFVSEVIPPMPPPPVPPMFPQPPLLLPIASGDVKQIAVGINPGIAYLLSCGYVMQPPIPPTNITIACGEGCQPHGILNVPIYRRVDERNKLGVTPLSPMPPDAIFRAIITYL